MPTFRGKPACDCLVQWLPAYEAELQARGILDGPLSIFQLIGSASASANTHSTGGAFDIVDLPGGEDLWVARQMGADATWSRKPPAFTPHIHGVLRGCPHNLPARYQIAAVDAGYNGLGAGGVGGPDDGPRPLSHRTWQQGIAWHLERQAARQARAEARQARRDQDLRGELTDAVQAAKHRPSLAERLRALRDRIGKPRR